MKASFSILFLELLIHETSSWQQPLGLALQKPAFQPLHLGADPESSSYIDLNPLRRHLRQIHLGNGEEISIISRTVQLTDDWSVTVWERHEPADIVDHYWNTLGRTVKDLDPFGIVNWPGSIVAARELQKYQGQIVNKTILVLGAGTGVEAQAVTKLGAKHVLATDYNPTTLKLLEYGVFHAGLEHVITTKLFDISSSDALPDCDIIIAADIMYSNRLSQLLSDRCLEARRKKHPPKILVSDSQRFVDFLPCLRAQLGDDALQWEERRLEAFTGSGVMVNEDQTYDVKARVLLIGWDALRGVARPMDG